MTDKQAQHDEKMQRKKAVKDAQIEAANQSKGLLVVMTGNGKGKSSSAFGMVLRALGHGQKAAVCQFIKGQQSTGEVIYLQNNHPELPYVAMGTGFTWDTQNWESDRAAAQAAWEQAKPWLSDPAIEVVLLDELTYMFKFEYLNKAEVFDAINNRPSHQHVIVTGRGASPDLVEIADTVSEVRVTKHAFKQGIKAQAGIDF